MRGNREVAGSAYATLAERTTAAGTPWAWLRRAKRRRDARLHLRVAEDMFQSMGAVGLAEQARNELRVTGEKVRTRTPGTELDLTTQETRVAKLAAA